MILLLGHYSVFRCKLSFLTCSIHEVTFWFSFNCNWVEKLLRDCNKGDFWVSAILFLVVLFVCISVYVHQCSKWTWQCQEVCLTFLENSGSIFILHFVGERGGGVKKGGGYSLLENDFEFTSSLNFVNSGANIFSSYL